MPLPTPTNQTVNNNVLYQDGNPIASTQLPNTPTPPVTPPPARQLIVTGNPANAEFNQYSGNLSSALAALNPTTPATPQQPETTVGNVSQTDPYAKMLDSLSATSNASTKALIASIQASRANQSNQINSQYENYKRGLESLGIEHNDAQATPDLLMGHIQAAENEQHQKLQVLDIEEKKALMDAETAQQNQDLTILKEKMDRVKAIKQEKQNVLKDTYEKMTTEKGIGDLQAHAIYDTLQTLNHSDKEKFLQEVAKKYNIPLTTLVQSVADEKVSRIKKVAKGATVKKLSVAEIKSLKGLYPDIADSIVYGMTGDDIETLITGNTTKTKDAETIKNTFNTKQLYDMALASGIEKNINFTRQDEIDKFLSPEVSTKINEAIKNGYSTQDIYNYFLKK